MKNIKLPVITTILLSLATMGLTACFWRQARVQGDPSKLTRVGDGALIEDIRLRPADPIYVRVGGIPSEDIAQISGSYIIDADGRINMPHVGKVGVAGKTQAEAQAAIEKAYAVSGVYAALTVTVEVPNAVRFIYIGGDVRASQRMPFTPDLTLFGAINAAGGFTDYADQGKVSLLRGNDVYVINVKAIRNKPALDVILKPGDKIEVPQSFW